LSQDELEIRQVIETWMESMRIGYTKRALSVIADDAVFLLPGHSRLAKADFEAAHVTMPTFIREVASDVEEVNIHGDVAFCINRLTVITTNRKGGDVLTRKGYSITVLEKRQGAWLIVRDANTLTTAED